MRKLLVVLMVLLVACMGFAAGEQEPEGPVTLEWFNHGGTSGGIHDMYVELLTEFNESQDDWVLELVQLPEGGYNEAVAAAALSDDLGDVIDVDGPLVANWAFSGWLVSLDEYVGEELENDILPDILAQGTYDGELYALGQYSSGLALWAARSYLEEIGARIPNTPDEAWTRAEWDQILADLKALPEIEYPLDLEMNRGPGWASYGLAPMFQMFGADLIDRSTMTTAEGALNGPKAVEAMGYFYSLFENEYVSLAPAGDEFVGTRTTAIRWDGHWMKNSFINALGPIGEELLLLPLPKLDERHVTGSGSWAYGIASTTVDEEGAWAFIDFMMTTENVLKMCNLTGGPPARLTAMNQSELYGPGGDLEMFGMQLASGMGLERPTTPAWPAIAGAFGDAMFNIAAGADIQEELDKAVEDIDEEIDDLGL